LIKLGRSSSGPRSHEQHDVVFIACGAFVGGARCKTWLEFGYMRPADICSNIRLISLFCQYSDALTFDECERLHPLKDVIEKRKQKTCVHTLENVWLKQPKIWFGQPNNLVDMALTKCLVETNQTAQPNVFGCFLTKYFCCSVWLIWHLPNVWLTTATKLFGCPIYSKCLGYFSLRIYYSHYACMHV
jgi:hypothetical protein